jgi:large subunit ribosomal protein L31e
MAKKETSVSGERIYVIPIRSEWLKVPRNRRGKRAVSAIRNFLSRHMHSDDIRLSQKLNKRIWKSGIKKPPSRVKVKVSVKDGVVTARLPEEIEIKKEEKKGKLEGLKEKAKAIKKGAAPEKTSSE